MHTKKNVCVIMLISNIIILLLSYFKMYIVSTFSFQSLGASVLLGILLYLPYILYIIIGALFLLWVVRNAPQHKSWSILTAATVAATIYLCAFFPFSTQYAKLYFRMFQNDIMYAVSMVETQNLEKYQIGEKEYYTPNLFASLSGTMHVEREGDNIKILFCTFRGFQTDAFLAYSSNAIPPTRFDFNTGPPFRFAKKYMQIENIGEHWYAIIYTT